MGHDFYACSYFQCEGVYVSGEDKSCENGHGLCGDCGKNIKVCDDDDKIKEEDCPECLREMKSFSDKRIEKEFNNKKRKYIEVLKDDLKDEIRQNSKLQNLIKLYDYDSCHLDELLIEMGFKMLLSCDNCYKDAIWNSDEDFKCKECKKCVCKECIECFKCNVCKTIICKICIRIRLIDDDKITDYNKLDSIIDAIKSCSKCIKDENILN